MAVLHGAKPGPVLAIVSGAHGTEYASIVAVQQLIDAVKPADLSGTLILVPLVNVPSFEKLTPHVNPTDNKSMNSRYPGDPNGTQTDRASAVITKEVVEQCDHLIDLHGGDLDENLRPYSYWTVTGNQKQDQESRAMLLAFGLDHIIISRPAEGSEGVAVSREHRDHARQGVVHGRGRALRTGRRRRRRRARQRIPRHDEASKDAGGRAPSRSRSRSGSKRSSRCRPSARACFTRRSTATRTSRKARRSASSPTT